MLSLHKYNLNEVKVIYVDKAIFHMKLGLHKHQFTL